MAAWQSVSRFFVQLLADYVLVLVYAAWRAALSLPVARRWLSERLVKWTCPDTTEPCRISISPQGVTISHFTVQPSSTASNQGSAEGGSSSSLAQLQRLHVALLRVQWLSWRQPLSLTMHGLQLHVKQLQTPEHCAKPAPPPVPSQLQLLEDLLWKGRRTPTKRDSPAQRLLLVYLLQRINVSITSSSVLYVQQGEPGPCTPSTAADAMDAVHLSVRAVVISPGDSAAAVTTGQPHHAVPALGSSGQQLTQLSVSGVALRLLHKSSQAAEQRGEAPQQQPVTRPTSRYAVLRQRRRARRLALTGAPPAPLETSGSSTGLAPALWDMDCCLLQQWSATVQLLVAEAQAQSMHVPHQAPRCPAVCIEVAMPGAAAMAAASTFAATTCGGQSIRDAEAGASSCQYLVSVTLKNLMLELTPQAAAIANRMLNRVNSFSCFGQYWRTRPQVPIRACPSAWWQHAGTAIMAECRKRLQVQSFRQALVQRRQYLQLYRAIHAQRPCYVNADASHRHRDPVLAAQELKQLESTMTLCEVATHRIFVALLHNRQLLERPQLRQEWLEVLDTLGSFNDMIPREGYAGQYPMADEPHSVAVQLTCPALGVQLVSPDRDQRVTAQVQSVRVVCPDILARSASATCSAERVLVHNQQKLLSNQPLHFPVLTVPGPSADCAGYTSSFDLRPRRGNVQTSGVAAAQPPGQSGPGPPGAGQSASALPRTKLPSTPTSSCTRNFSSTFDSAAAGAPQQQQQQRQAPSNTDSCPRGACGIDVDMARIYRRSLVCLYLTNFKLEVAPVKLTVDPGLVTQLLDYVQQVQQAVASTQPPTHNPLQHARRLAQEVLESYQRSGTRLAYSLSSFLPVFSIRCPELAVVLPLRNSSQLHSQPLQPAPGSKHELAVVMEGLQLGVRYENSCFSSLVQHVEAMADLEVRFQQQFRSAAAAAAASGPYAAIWLHPDDIKHLEQLAGPSDGSWGGDEEATHNTWNGAAPSQLPSGPLSLLPVQLPFVPLVRAPRLWTQLSTQIPSEPAVPGTERCHGSSTAAGILAWLSPWQVDLLMGGIDQVIRDALLLRDRIVRDLLKPAVGPISTPVHGTIHAAAAAAAGPAASDGRSGSSSSTSSNGSGTPPSGVAEVPSMSMLVDLPYLELLCFADVSPGAQYGPQDTKYPLVQPSWLTNYHRRDRAASQFLTWASSIAPVGSLLLCGSRAGLCSCPSGTYAAKARLGSLVVSNLQLKELSQEQLHQPAVQQGSRWSGADPREMPGHAACSHQDDRGPLHAGCPMPTDLQQQGISEVDVHSFAVSGLTSTAVAAYCFGKNRRHLLLGLPAALTACLPSAPGDCARLAVVSCCRQLWQVPLQMRLRLRAADYALYLLSQPLQAWPAGSGSLQDYTLLYDSLLSAETTAQPAPAVPAAQETGLHSPVRWRQGREKGRSSLLGSPGVLSSVAASNASTPGGSPRSIQAALSQGPVLGLPPRHRRGSHGRSASAGSIDIGSSLSSSLTRSGPPPLPMHGGQLSLRSRATTSTGEPVSLRQRAAARGRSNLGVSAKELEASLRQLDNRQPAASAARSAGEDSISAVVQQPQEGALGGISLMRMLKSLRTGSLRRRQQQHLSSLRWASSGQQSSDGGASLLARLAATATATVRRLASRSYSETGLEAPPAGAAAGAVDPSLRGWAASNGTNHVGGPGAAAASGIAGDGPMGPAADAAGNTGRPTEEQPDELLVETLSWLDFVDHFTCVGGAAGLLGRGGSVTGWSPYSKPQLQVSHRHAAHHTHQRNTGSALGSALPAEFSKELSVTLAQLKVLLGPHTLSMALQMATSVQQVLNARGGHSFANPGVPSSSQEAASSAAGADGAPAANSPPNAGEPAQDGAAALGSGLQSSSADEPRRSPSAMHISISMHAVQLKLLMDSVSTAGGIPVAALSRSVARVLLLGSCFSYRPLAAVRSRRRVSGTAISCRLGQLLVQDLQSAVEHKSVLSSNILEGDARRSASSISDNCTLDLQCLLPEAALEPVQLILVCSNPRLVLLRRFVNNVAFVSGQMSKELSARTAASSSSPAHAPPALEAVQPSAAQHAQPGPSVVVKVVNMQLILPTSHVCKAAGDHYALIEHHQAQRWEQVVPSAPLNDNRSRFSPSSSLSEQLPASWAFGPPTTRPEAAAAAAHLQPELRRSSPVNGKLKYAWHREMLVANIATLVVMSPGTAGCAPAMKHALRQHGCAVPVWLTNEAESSQLVANSRAVLSAHTVQQPQPPPQQQPQQQGPRATAQQATGPVSSVSPPAQGQAKGGSRSAGAAYPTPAGRPAAGAQPGTVVFQPSALGTVQVLGAAHVAAPNPAAEQGLLQLPAVAPMQAAAALDALAAGSSADQKGKTVMSHAQRAGKALRHLFHLHRGSKQQPLATAGAAVGLDEGVAGAAEQSGSAAEQRHDAAGQSAGSSTAAAPPPPTATLLLSLDNVEVLAGTILKGNPYPNPKSQYWQQPAAVQAAAAGPFAWCTLRNLQHILHPTSMQAAVYSIQPQRNAAAVHANGSSGSNGSQPTAAAATGPGAATVLHLEFGGGVEAALSPGSYQTLMAACTGNLVDWCSTFTPAHVKTAKVREGCSRAYNTNFGPGLKFGPAPTDAPAFILTLGTGKFEGTLFNNPTWWLPKLAQLGLPANRLVPCAKIMTRPMSLSLQSMQGTGDLYFNITCPDAEVQDVRLLSPVPSAATTAAATADAVHGSSSDSNEGSSSYWMPPSAASAAMGRQQQQGAGAVDTAQLPQGAGYAAKAQQQQQQQSAGVGWVNSNNWQVRHPARPDVAGALPSGASPLPGRSAFAAAAGQGRPSQGHQSEDLRLQSPEDGEQGLFNFDAYPYLMSVNESEGLLAPVSIIRTEEGLPAAEGVHLATADSSAGAGGRSANASPSSRPDGTAQHGAAAGNVKDSFRVSFGYLADGTMVLEVHLAGMLLQWPYLTDMSLVSSIVSVFVSTWGGPPWKLEQILQVKRWPYLYFNLLINDSQLYLPFMAPHMHRQQLESADCLPSIWLQLRDVFTQQVSDSVAGAFRFGYFYGGDGDCRLLMDLRNAASFFRDSRAVVTNWLLPLKALEFELDWDLPHVEQHQHFKPILMVLRRMLLQHRLLKRRRQALLRATHARSTMAGTATAEQLAADQQDGGSSHTHSSTAGKQDQEAPELRLLQLAEAHAQAVLAEQGLALTAASKSSSSNNPGCSSSGTSPGAVLGLFTVSRPWLTAMRIRMEPLRIRAAFSNIPAWKLLLDEVGLLQLVSSKGLGLFSPNPRCLPTALAERQAGRPWPPPPQGWAAEFRRRMTRVDAQIVGVSVVLCDDKPTCFGAPDVLQATLGALSITYGQDCRLADVPAEYAARIHLAELSVDFLNNSSSRWERLVEPWPLTVAVSDPINPMFKSSRTRYIQLLSNDPLRVNFHPACLLTLGDALAFHKAMSATEQPSVPLAPPTVRTASDAEQLEAGLPELAHEPSWIAPGQVAPAILQLQQLNAPSMQDQMALAGAVTDRVPQRYLINNQTGLNMWYWACANPEQHAVTRKSFLAAHKSEELRVAPVARPMQRVAPDGMVTSRGCMNVISVQLEGCWLPLEEVAVDVVGKYRYEAKDPQGRAPLAVVVDVLLVGRTKMLKLHSALWVQNNTGLKMGLQLQLPYSLSGIPVVLAPGDRLDEQQIIHMKPLRPKEGRFLPAPAALGGQLRVQPAGYSATRHDVLQLHNSVLAMKEQQGYISCEPLPKTLTRSPLHLSASVHLGLQTDPYFTTQNYVEVPRAGQQRRARFPLEAAIRINPILQLTNALPYGLTCYVVTSGGRATPAAPSVAAASAVLTTRTEPTSVSSPRHQGGPAAAPITGSTAAPVGAATPVSTAQQLQSSLRGEPVVKLPAGKAAARVTEGHRPASRQSSLLQTGDRQGSASSTPVAAAQSWIHRGHPHPSPSPSQRRSSLLLLLPRRGSYGPAATPSGGPPSLEAWQEMPESADEQRQLLQEVVQHMQQQQAVQDQLVQEFLLTLQVLSSSTMGLVDPEVLGLLDLQQTQAVIVGLLKEEFKSVSKSLLRDFVMLQKLESESLLQQPAELLQLLFWVQQHVAAVELSPGTAGDLFVDPTAVAHAAVHVPALRLSSKPTPISAGSGQYVRHSDLPHSIRLAYVPDDQKSKAGTGAPAADASGSATASSGTSGVSVAQLSGLPSLQCGVTGLPSQTSGSRVATEGVQGALVPLQQLQRELLLRQTSKARDIARISRLYLMVHQYDAMRSSDIDLQQPPASEQEDQEHGMFAAAVLLTQLVADMVRLAGYAAKLYGLIADTPGSGVLDQPALLRGRSESALQLSALQLQHAEVVAYMVQFERSSNSSSPAWLDAVQQLASALVHPPLPIAAALEQLQQSTDRLLTSDELQTLMDYLCAEICNSSWAQQVVAMASTARATSSRRSQKQLLATTSKSPLAPQQHASASSAPSAPAAPATQPTSSVAAGPPVQRHTAAGTPVMWSNQVFDSAAGQSRGPVAMHGSVRTTPFALTSSEGDGEVHATTAVPATDPDQTGAGQMKRTVSWLLPRGEVQPPGVASAAADVGSAADAQLLSATTAVPEGAAGDAGGSSSSTVPLEIEPAEDVVGADAAPAADPQHLESGNSGRGMQTRPRPSRLLVTETELFGIIQPVRSPRLDAGAGDSSMQPGSSASEDESVTGADSAEEADAAGIELQPQASSGDWMQHHVQSLVTSLRKRQTTLKRLAANVGQGAVRLAQVQTAVQLRMLLSHQPHPRAGKVAQMGAEHTASGADAALGHHRGSAGWCAPSALVLGLLNSAGQGSSGGSGHTVRLTLHARYWLDNRSGLDLLVRDLDRHLLHASSMRPRRLPCTSVYAPGLATDASAMEENVAGGPPSATTEQGAALPCQVHPTLLNDQPYLSLHVLEVPAALSGSNPPATADRRMSITDLPTDVGAVPAPAADDKQGKGASAELLRSRVSPSFRISVTGDKTNLSIRGSPGAQYYLTRSHQRAFHNLLLRQQSTGTSVEYMLLQQPELQQLEVAAAAAPSSTPPHHNSIAALPPLVHNSSSMGSSGGAAQQPRSELPAAGSPVAAGTPASALPMLTEQREPLKGAPVQRLYELAVEVWPGPTDGPFRATKVISIKSKYLLLNDTGMRIEFKQKGTPDLQDPHVLAYGHGKRFAGSLDPNQRCVLHWDNVNCDRQLVIRPQGANWDWSGSFTVPDKEQYFGLRIRNKVNKTALILPVNTTVGRSGTVLITLKSRDSIPPYRIDNRCKKVSLRLRQQGQTGTWDVLSPNSSMPFAWDQPQGTHAVEVQGAIGAGKQVWQQYLQQASAVYRFNELKPQRDLQIKSSMAGVVPSGASVSSLAALAAREGSKHAVGKGSAAGQATEADSTALLIGPTGSAAGVVERKSISQGHRRQGSNAAEAASSRSLQPAQSMLAGGKRAGAAAGSVSTRMGGANLLLGGSAPLLLGQAGVQPMFSALAKRVFVKVYADGPTHVLVFSDEPIVGLTDEGGGLQQLTARLQRVGKQMRHLESDRLAQLGGVPKDSGHVMRTAGLRAADNTPFGAGRGQPAAAGRTVRPSEQALQRSSYTSGTTAAAAGSTSLGHAAGSSLSGAAVQPDVRPYSSEGEGSALHGGSGAGFRDSSATPEVAAPPAFQVSCTPQRRVELEKLMAVLESSLPIGGDLKVKVLGARGLAMATLYSHPYAVITVGDNTSRVLRTPPVFNSNSPVWDAEETWSEVCGMEDLRVQVYSLSYNAGLLTSISEAYENSIFLGQAVVPLLHTLPGYPGAPGLQPCWFQLGRQLGRQQVGGEVQLAFEWTITREGLLSIEVALLERLLHSRLEAAAMRSPLSSQQVSAVLMRYAHVLPSSQAGMAATTATRSSLAGTAPDGAPSTVQDLQHQQQLALRDRAWAGLEIEADDAAASSSHTSGESRSVLQVFDGLDLSLGSSHLMNLEVQVLEARHLEPRLSWQQRATWGLLRGGEAAELLGNNAETQRARQLPQACVVVEVGGAQEKDVAYVPSLSPTFRRLSMKFSDVSPRFDIKVSLYDSRDMGWHLLGSACLPASAISGTDPVYLWLPLQAPVPEGLPIIKHWQRRRSARAGQGELVTGAAQECVQVLLRLQISRPRRRRVLNSLQVALAGALLNVKTDSADELMNWTIDTVRAVLQTSSSQLQLSLLVQSVQLDNQLLETRHPVVLSPGTGNQSRFKDSLLQETDTDKMLADLLQQPQPAGGSTVAAAAAGASGAAASGTLLRVDSRGRGGGSTLYVTPGSSGAGVLQQQQARPMIWLSVCQLLTGAGTGPLPARMATAANTATAVIAATAVPSSSESALDELQRSQAPGGGVTRQVSQAAIVSFRKVELQLGALDLETEQAFLEAVYVWAHTLPLQDLWQDDMWMARVAVLQGVTAISPAAGGPSLTIPIHANTGRALMAMNGRLLPAGFAGGGAMEAAAAAASAAGGFPAAELMEERLQQAARGLEPAAAASQVLAWLMLQHEKELQLMKGQSSIWYFLEQLYISSLSLNVTIAVNTSIISSTTGASATAAASSAGSSRGGGASSSRAGADADAAGSSSSSATASFVSEVQRQLVKRLVSSIGGGMDYQLINVSNVGLHLAKVQLDSRLVNQVGLAGELVRHYRWQGLKEARKVLGGTGPGILQIPASLLWAGISTVDLVREVAERKRSPLQLPPALIHMGLVVAAQLVGVVTRCAAAVWEGPLKRRGALSDTSALQRFVRTPRTAGDAFGQAAMELYWGLCSSLMGLLLDPMTGARWPGAWALLGVTLGLIKGTLGVGVRAGLGAADAGSKALRGAGLLFLGRRGIHGKVVRRVRPPGAAAGALDEVQGLAGSSLPGAGGLAFAQEQQQERLRAAWQPALAVLLPQLAGEQVKDVVATRPLRLVLLTSGHVAYLRARLRGGSPQRMAYTVRWVLACDAVDHVRGAEDTLRVVLEYQRAWAWRSYHLNVPLHHSLRCSNPDVYQRVIKRVSRHLGEAKGRRAAAGAGRGMGQVGGAAEVASGSGAAASSSSSVEGGAGDLLLMRL